ncbi:MAG: hypothetical protein WA715_05060 [Candidatus Acidiferrum sp.]
MTSPAFAKLVRLAPLDGSITSAVGVDEIGVAIEVNWTAVADVGEILVQCKFQRR